MNNNQFLLISKFLHFKNIDEENHYQDSAKLFKILSVINYLYWKFHVLLSKSKFLFQLINS